MLRLLNSQLGKRGVVDDALSHRLLEKYPTLSIPNVDLTNSEQYLVERIINNRHFYNLCIDGMSCSGKSTVINRLTKDYSACAYKINSELECKDYNFNSTTAFQYALKQALNYKKMKRCIIDRSILSNLTFQLVYWLMSCEDSMYEKLSPHCLCVNYIRMHQMEPVLEFIKAQNHNVLIVVNSDFERVCRMMVARGAGGDVYKGLVPKYVASQYHAYIFMANVLELPVFDHARVDSGVDSFERLYKITSRMFSLLTGDDDDFDAEFNLLEMSNANNGNDDDDANNGSSSSTGTGEGTSAGTGSFSTPIADKPCIKRSKPTEEEWLDRLVSLQMNKR
ncbi:Orf111 [Heliothis zea nudivirus]|uniref:Orf111 n=1 Tax=Heliothis zea nudivirus 1 TaxID=3116536 RepID=Q8JKK2_9VIRU|nr:Orf111 [Heliothis zea nudivirus]AAN04404.1 Orf111 [Heliothis zea nudivirus]